MKELQLKTTKIDWLNLIELTLDRKEWGKTFNLYIYGDVIITITMASFNFIQNKAVFNVKCDYHGEMSEFWYNKIEVVYPLSNFEVYDFERILNLEIFRMIRRVIERECNHYAERKYRNLQYHSWNITDEQIENSPYKEDYYFANNLSSDFSKEVISEIKDKIAEELNSKFRKKVKEFSDNYRLEKTKLQIYYDLIKKDYKE